MEEQAGPPQRFVDGAPAWEQAGRGFLARFFGTFIEACFSPAAFFDHLSRAGARGITAFAWWCTFVGVGFSSLTGWLAMPLFVRLARTGPDSLSAADRARAEALAQDDAAMGALVSTLQWSEELASQAALAEAQLLTSALLSPLIALFAVHLVAGLVHVTVRPFTAEPTPYVVTHRFVVYAFAPMLFAAIPTVGFFAPLLTLILVTVAMSKLHRLNLTGRLLGVVMPILALNLTWSSMVLPALAPQVAELLGQAPPATPANPDANPDDDDPLPPMPAWDRPHEVELFEDGETLYSERVWDAARTRLLIQHRATPRADGGVDVEVRVTNRGERAWAGLVVEVPVPDRAQVREDAVLLDGERYELAPEAARPWGYRERLAPGETFRLGFGLTEGAPRALLQVGPSVGRL